MNAFKSNFPKIVSDEISLSETSLLFYYILFNVLREIHLEIHLHEFVTYPNCFQLSL